MAKADRDDLISIIEDDEKKTLDTKLTDYEIVTRTIFPDGKRMSDYYSDENFEDLDIELINAGELNFIKTRDKINIENE